MPNPRGGMDKLLFGAIDTSKKAVLEKLGKWSAVSQLRAKELIQIAGEFPEHEYWILTGKKMLKSGQLT